MSPIITKIEPQKKKKNRYSLFSGDTFIAGVSEESLLEFNIYQGVELTDKKLAHIQKKENSIAAREQAWRYLARRSHSVKELQVKLSNKKFAPEIIAEITEDFRKKNYLNDEEFSRQLIQDEINIKKNGPLLIKNKLIQKGVSLDLINDLLDEMYDESAQTENCQFHALKKYRHLPGENRNKQLYQLSNYLKQKGFSWEIAQTIVREICDDS